MAVNLIISPLVKVVCVVIPLVGMTSISGYWGFVLSYDAYCALRNAGAPPVICFVGHQVGLNTPNWCVFCLYHFILTQPLHTTTLSVGLNWWMVMSGKLGMVVISYLFSALYGRLSLEALWSLLLSKSSKGVSFNPSLLILKGLSVLLYTGWGVLCTVGLITPFSVLNLVGGLLLGLVLFFNNVIVLFFMTGHPGYKSLSISIMINLMTYAGVLGFVLSVLMQSI